MPNPFIIGLQGDPRTWQLPPTGKTAFGVNQAGLFTSLQSDGTITTLNLGAVAWGVPVVNAGGVTTILPINPTTTQQVTVTGAPRNVQIVLSTTGAIAGSIIRLKLFVAQTAGLVLQIYNGSTAGSLLWGFTSDGTLQTTSAYAEFSFDGTQWNFDTARVPNP